MKGRSGSGLTAHFLPQRKCVGKVRAGACSVGRQWQVTESLNNELREWPGRRWHGNGMAGKVVHVRGEGGCCVRQR